MGQHLFPHASADQVVGSVQIVGNASFAASSRLRLTESRGMAAY